MDTTSGGGDPACHLHLVCPDCGAVAEERRAPCCARYAGPVRHPWLGVLRPDGEGRLTGGIEIAPTLRPGFAEPARDCAVTIGPGAGAGPADLDAAAARVREALEGLVDLEEFALAHAPGTPARERLLLAWIEVVSPDAMEVAFAYGGPGTLIVRVDGSGRGREVRTEP